MIRIFLLLAVMVSFPAFASCERAQSPMSESWNPAPDQVEPCLKRFYSINRELEESMLVSDTKTVVPLINEYLSLAEVYKQNWNHGNAIHNANTALGTIAMWKGDLNQASKYLIEAGKTPGSPQLSSFGPDLALANALLQAGKVDEVVEYLTLASKFWSFHRKEVLAAIERVKNGERPQLNRSWIMHAAG